MWSWVTGQNMIPIGIQAAIVAAAVALSAGGLIYVRRLVRTSGRDRPHDPERVDRFVQAFRASRGTVPRDVNLGIDDDCETETDRIQRFLDALGRLSADHGVWIDNSARGTLLDVRADRAVGYHAWPWPGGGRPGIYEIDCYTAGRAVEGDGVIVGEDHSPAAREERARAWREENAEALNSSRDDVLRMLDEGRASRLGRAIDDATFQRLRERARDQDQSWKAEAVAALNRACEEHGIELRAGLQGVVIVPARPTRGRYQAVPAEFPVGGALLVEPEEALRSLLEQRQAGEFVSVEDGEAETRHMIERKRAERQTGDSDEDQR